MPSCSNSSNISASINALNVTQGGSRLEVQIPFVSGLTLGNVIRWDVASQGYTASLATGPAESEVFGVIESLDSTTTPPSFTVIVYGSIKYPTNKLAAIDATGGSGENDIYFLSGQTAGVLQNLAPSNLLHIVKPVYQVAPHGRSNFYTGVIINYLGYRIGGEVEAVLEDEEIGNIQIVVGNDTFENGYVNASTQHRLLITEYPEFYSKYGKKYGYIEKIITQNPLSLDIAIGQESSITQAGGYIGKIVEVDLGNQILYVSRSADAELADTNKLITVKLNNGSNINYQINGTTTVYEVYTPIVQLVTNPLDIEGVDGDVSTATYVGIKVRAQGITVTIPSKVASLTVTNLKYGPSETDLTTTLNSILQDIQNIKPKVGVS